MFFFEQADATTYLLNPTELAFAMYPLFSFSCLSPTQVLEDQMKKAFMRGTS